MKCSLFFVGNGSEMYYKYYHFAYKHYKFLQKTGTYIQIEGEQEHVLKTLAYLNNCIGSDQISTSITLHSAAYAPFPILKMRSTLHSSLLPPLHCSYAIPGHRPILSLGLKGIQSLTAYQPKGRCSARENSIKCDFMTHCT